MSAAFVPTPFRPYEPIEAKPEVSHTFQPYVHVTTVEGRVTGARVEWFDTYQSSWQDTEDVTGEHDVEASACAFLDQAELQAELQAVLDRWVAK